MNGADKLIDILMSDEKLKNSKAFSSKIYKDEPIFRKASQLAPRTGDDVPAKLQELAKELKNADFYSLSSSQRFCRCAAITEDFEDDYENEERFARFFPSFEVMSNEQLRTYFTWRTHARKGEVRNTYPSYFYLYVYELINQFGVSDAEDGYIKLRDLWRAFRKYESGVDRNMKIWLRDYIVYYGLDKALLSDVESPENDSSVSVLIRCGECGDDDLYNALCTLTSYKVNRSEFIKKYPEEYKKVICSVFRKMSNYYSEHRSRSLCEKMFGRGLNIGYTMFYSAVFFDSRQYESYDYIINDGYRYSCRNGSWKCSRLSTGQSKSTELGNMMSSTEYIMCEKYDFPEKREPEKMTKILADIIRKETEKVISEKKKSEERKITFDFSALEGIRRAAEATCEKLTVEEETDSSVMLLCESSDDKCSEEKENSFSDDISVTADSAENNDPDPGKFILDNTEKEFVRCLLYGEDYRAVLKQAHTMASIAADSVNEKLFDMFGDTVIDFDGDEPYIIEDYTEELKGMFG